MNPFVKLFHDVLWLYTWAVIIWAVLGLLIHFKVVNRAQPLVAKTDEVLGKIIDPVLKPIRKYVPPIGGVDITPIILIVALNFLSYAIFYYSF